DVRRRARASAHFRERALIGERRAPFAHGEASLLVLALHGLLAALALGERAAAPALVGFLFPAHAPVVLPVAKVRTLKEIGIGPKALGPRGSGVMIPPDRKSGV